MTKTARSLLIALMAATGIAGVFATASSAAAETKLKMVLNWKYQGPQGWFFLAQDRGYFKKAGIDITMDQGNGSGAPIPLVANGTYDVGFGDINALIQFAATKPEEAPIAVYVHVQPAAFHYCGAMPTVRSRRRRISRARRSAAPPATARSSCSRPSARSPKSTARTIKITNMQPNLREQMLMKKQVDGVFGYVNTIRFCAKLMGVDRQGHPLHQVRRLRHGPLFQRDHRLEEN